jgi:hypothetical protein
MNVALALANVVAAEAALEHALRSSADQHPDEADFATLCRTVAEATGQQRSLLAPFEDRYGTTEVPVAGFAPAPRTSTAPLLSDLRALLLLAFDAETAWLVLGQLGNALRDRPLLDAVCTGHENAEIRCKWLRSRIKESCTQALLQPQQ